MNKIDEIKEALAAATPGPWEWREGKTQHLEQGRLFGSDGTEICWFGNYATFYPTAGDEPEKEDIDLIAKSPEYITYLLQLVDELNGALDEPKKNLLFQMHNERIKKYEVIRERNELLRKIERKDEALRFYENTKNYEQEKCLFDGNENDMYYEAPEIMLDLGQRAREAL